MNIIRSVFILLAAAVISGCATSPKPLYSWNEYQPVVYEYYALDMGPQEQIEALKKILKKRGRRHFLFRRDCMRIWGCYISIPVTRSWQKQNLNRRNGCFLNPASLWIFC